jgi:hypothetical protein
MSLGLSHLAILTPEQRTATRIANHKAAINRAGILRSRRDKVMVALYRHRPFADSNLLGTSSKI